MPSKQTWWIVGATIGVVVVGVAARLATTKLDFFKIHLVEVDGVRYLDPDQVVAQLGISVDANILLDLAAVAAAAMQLPGVRYAEASRRWPGTIHLQLTEAPAVAVAEVDGHMVVLDERAEVLPFRPGAVEESLPLIERDSATAALLGRLRQADPEWYRVFDRAVTDGGTVSLIAGVQSIEVNSGADQQLLRRVAAVRQWLERSARPWLNLDARYRGRIFVRKDEA
jgi:hypothetical protein